MFAFNGFAGLGAAISSVVEDATTLFQDGVDAFEPTPEELRPELPVRKKSSIKVPDASEYTWTGLEPADKRMIRLVTIEGNDDCPSDLKDVECHLLDTGQPMPQLKCMISENDLDQLPEDGYEAVSYSWLDMPADIPLVIGEKILNVNPSLVVCLQHLLKKKRKMTLWWDNICVKQTDKGEIARQVGFMKDIFGRAKRTYIWLGQDDGDSTVALETLNKICPLDGSGFTSREDRKRKAEALTSAGFREQNSETSAKRIAVGRFLNRKYFERAWIYQEAAASKEIVVMVGDRELNFDRLCDAVTAYCKAEGEKMRRTDISLGNPLQIVAHGYNTLRAIRQGRTELNISLQTLLCRVAGSVKATKQHDLVYAFLGFQDPKDKADITIDYESPVADTYNAAARALLKQTKNLDIFGICGGEMEGLASWAPNWTTRLPQGQPICQADMVSPFKASKGMKFYLTSNGAELLTHGCIIDNVAAVSGLKFKYAERNRLGIDNFLRLQNHVDFLKGKFSRERVLKALLANGAFEESGHMFDQPVSQTEKFDSKLLQAYDNENIIRRETGGGHGLLASPGDLRAAYVKLRKQSLICVRKMLFLSEKKSLGLAPETVEAGDVVAILNGSRVPLVLRKNGGEQYRLVGQAYFEGAMNGEKTTWRSDEQADSIILV